MDKIKAAGYIRVSTTGQGRNGASIEVQERDIKAQAALKGWELVSMHTDNGYSGASFDRPGWAQLVQEAEAGQFSVVLAWDSSRVARDLTGLLNISDKLGPLGVELVTVKDSQMIGGAVGSSQRTETVVKGLFNEMELAKIKQRMAEGKDYKRRTGAIYVGSVPYGYQYAGNFQFELDPDKAPVVKRIVAMYLVGQSIKQIAATLVAEGADGKNMPRTPTSVSKILQEEAYTGQMTRNQFEYHKPKGKKYAVKVLDDNGQPVLKPQKEWLTYTLPVLITPEQWAQIKAKKDLNRTKSRRGQYGDPDKMAAYWLRNSMKCAHCGSALKPRTQKNNGRTYEYYTCHYSRCGKNDLITSGRSELCPLPTIQAEGVHAMVWAKAHSVLIMGGENKGVHMYPHYDAKGLSPVINTAQYDKKLESIAKRIEATRAEEAAALASYNLNLQNISDPDFEEQERAHFRRALNDAKARKNSAIEERRRLEAQHAEVTDAKGNDKLRAQLAEYGPIVLAQVAQRLHELEPADKQRLIEAMANGPIIIDGKKGPKGGRVDRGALWHVKDMDLIPGRALGVLNELRLEGKLDIDSPYGAAAGKQFDLMDYLGNLYKLAA